MLAPAKPDARVVQIDRARKAQGLSHEGLCHRANVSRDNWWRIRNGQWAPSKATIARLQAALAGQYAGTSPTDLVRVAIASTLALLRMSAPAPIADGRLRRLAVYLVAVELQIENADVARALNMSRQNVQQARNIVEDLRERDPATDALLERCTALIKGIG